MPMENHKDEGINFGRSLIVPSVQELAKKSITKIPPRYVRQDHHENPLLIPSDDTSNLSVPVIDVHNLFASASESSIYSSELIKLHSASKEWGFFQVINHGISESLLEDFKSEVLNFFKLPMEEKQKLWQTGDSQEGFGQLFVASDEQKLDWSDMFYLNTLPDNIRNSQIFQKLPPVLREKLEAYSREIKKLSVAILGQMAKALGMGKEEMAELFNDGTQFIRMNYYPPCPEPEMALGFSPHSDATALTILYQLNETVGLQVRKDGNWVSVKPLPNALVVNVGDIMEIVSNGVYKSIEHRATVHSNRERLSVATFYSCGLGSELGPARSLVAQHNVENFRRVTLEEFYKDYFARKLDGKSNLEFMQLGGLTKIVSNGVYKSIEHRATVHSNRERLSVATFYSCGLGSELGPARSLVAQHNVENFRRVTLEEFYKDYFARKLDGKSNLEFMQLGGLTKVI